MKKVKFIVFICLFILLPLAYFNGFIRISDLTSEQESIAKKYGGVYVFDEKLEREIDRREEERDKYLDDFSTSELDSENRDILKDEFDELQALISEKLDEITELDLEESDDSDLFPNGRDTDAEDEDGI